MFHRTTKGYTMYFCNWLSTQWQIIFFRLLQWITLHFFKIYFHKYGKATWMKLMKKFSTFCAFNCELRYAIFYTIPTWYKLQIPWLENKGNVFSCYKQFLFEIECKSAIYWRYSELYTFDFVKEYFLEEYY